jgi:glycosyltransferase involved in cell wall biosynthesis
VSRVGSPRVTVIVPAFDAERTLQAAVESALTGTFPGFELIIVDDGSKDDTPDVARGLADSDPRVRLMRRENGGVSAAFNSGLALATGDYVARLDSDDLWHPTKLQKQMELADREPGLAFIYTFVRYIDADGHVREDGPAQRFPRRALCRGIYESLVGGNSSALIRRDRVVELGGYDEELISWEDLLLQLKISANSVIDYIPEYLVGYRVRPNSLSKNVPDMFRSWRTARQKVYRAFPDIPRRVRNWADSRRLLDFAEAFAWRGDYGRSSTLLAKASFIDPVYTYRYLRFRVGRRLARGRSQPTGSAQLRRFIDCNPSDRIDSPCADLPKSLQEMEKERIAWISKIDAIRESAAGPF